MRCVSYDRNGREAAIADFCERRGIRLLGSFPDGDGEYGSLRGIQNLVKRDECDAVVLYDYSSLGEDGYIRLENELFFRRNGARLIFVKKPECDSRRNIVIAARRMFSYVTEWDEAYGLALPERGNNEPSDSMLPFGYRAENGTVIVDEADAETVRRIFGAYIEGKPIFEIVKLAEGSVSKRGMRFTNMTVKTVLKNERYLGRISKKGVKLPPIIRCDTWLMARERLERDYGPIRELKPFVDKIYRPKRLSFVRSGAGVIRADSLTVDSDVLEKELIKHIVKAAACENAEPILEYAEVQRRMAEEAYPEAVREKNRVTLDFARELGRVTSGDFSVGTQRALERLTDLKTVYGMRLRRIASERELFSVSGEEINRFLERARSMDRLSYEEQGLIANAFVRAVRIGKNLSEAVIASPKDGGNITVRLENVLYQ